MRTLTVFLSLLCLLLPVRTAQSQTANAPASELLFEVWREGSPMGRHRLTFTPQGDRLTVDIAIDLSVGLGPFTLYRYQHRSQEIWQLGRLIGLSTQTDDDGDNFRVVAALGPQGLALTEGMEKSPLPAGIQPTSYWHAASLGSGNGVMLDTQDGRLRQITIRDLGPDRLDINGRPSETRRYRISGDLEMDLWYLPTGDWAGLEFTARGSKITYRRLTPPDVAVVPPGFAPRPGDSLGSRP